MLTEICYVGNEARDSVMTFVNSALRIHNKVVGDILAFYDLPEGDSFKQEFRKRFVKFEENIWNNAGAELFVQCNVVQDWMREILYNKNYFRKYQKKANWKKFRNQQS